MLHRSLLYQPTLYVFIVCLPKLTNLNGISSSAAVILQIIHLVQSALFKTKLFKPVLIIKAL